MYTNAQVKHRIALTPLYWRRTSDVAMSGEVFYGRTDGWTADKKRRKNFVVGSPLFIQEIKIYNKNNILMMNK